MDVALPKDKVEEFTRDLMNKLNRMLAKLKSAFFIEDFVETIKFAIGEQSADLIGHHSTANHGIDFPVQPDISRFSPRDSS